MPAKNVIKLRTGTGTPAAASFAASEPAWDSTNGLLYVKNAAGSMVPIGVIPYATTTAFPSTGVSPTLYVATDTNRLYRWTGTAYAEVGAATSGGSGTPTRSIVDLGLQATTATALTIAAPADTYDGVVTVQVQSNLTFTITSPTSAVGFRLIIRQDSVGGRVATFAGSITWSDGYQPNWNINANTFVVLRLLWIGSTFLAWLEAQPQPTNLSPLIVR